MPGVRGPWGAFPAVRTAARVFAGLLWGVLRAMLFLAGAMALLLALLAFTSVPFHMHRWLGTAAGECRGAPGRIVVLGGSGMPSGPELLRLHRAADLAHELPMAAVLVVHPGDGAVRRAMVDELVLRGVAHGRIEVLDRGDNTREQAMLCASRWPGEMGAIALVTAPENMYRSVQAFRKAGLPGTCGAPAWDHAMDHGFRYDHRAIGGRAYTPDVSGAPLLRYTFWHHVRLEVTCLREYVALAYYRLNGWV